MGDKIKKWMDSAIESLGEQEWFQQLKAKWEELDPQSRTYLRYAGTGVSALLLVFIIFKSIWGVHSLRIELNEKMQLLNLLQSANDELSRLKETNSSAGDAGSSDPWPAYFEGKAKEAGIPTAGLSVSEGKSGSSTDNSKENLFELTAKHVNIRQVVRLAYFLENGGRPVKLLNMMVDTKEDPTGYMDATLSVSTFTLVTK